MHVHQPDLAAKIRTALRPPENSLEATAVLRRPVHQPRPIGTLQVPLDEFQVPAGLLRREDSADDAAHHRQQTVADTGPGVARMQQQFHVAVVLKEAVTRDDPVTHQVPVEIFPDGVTDSGQFGRPLLPAGPLAQLGIGRKGLVIEFDSPGRDHTLAEFRIGRLHCIVPVAAAERDQRCFGKVRPGHQGNQAVDMLAERRRFDRARRLRHVERQWFIQEGRIAAAAHIVAER